MTTAYLRVILSMEILISYAPYRHQRYSSTNSLKCTAVWHGERKCLFPLRIYTALKHITMQVSINRCLFPLRIYTALKQFRTYQLFISRLFPLRIYTALKLRFRYNYRFQSLFPLRIYTALKPSPEGVSIFSKFVSPTNLHCSQTAVLNQFVSILFVSPTNLHCSQTLSDTS